MILRTFLRNKQKKEATFFRFLFQIAQAIFFLFRQQLQGSKKGAFAFISKAPTAPLFLIYWS